MIGPFDWGVQLPRLQGRGLALRWIEAGDSEAIFSILGDPEVCKLLDGRPMAEPHEADEYIQGVWRDFERRLIFRWGICDAETDELLGTCSLYYLNYEHRRAEVGIMLARRAWGRGFASEALRVLIGFAFDALDLHRIEADIDPANAPSLALFERQGFKREGILRERWHLPTRIHDTILLGLLRREWHPDQ